MPSDTAGSAVHKRSIDVRASLLAMRGLSADESQVLLQLSAHTPGAVTFSPAAPWVEKALKQLKKKNLVVETDRGYCVSGTVARAHPGG